MRKKKLIRKYQYRKKPRIITKYRGLLYRYTYRRTVHSLQELDNFRFEHQCFVYRNYKVCCRMYCNRKANGRSNCPFALLAVRSKTVDNKFYIYAHKKHNHRVLPADERRALHHHNVMGKRRAMSIGRAPSSNNANNNAVGAGINDATKFVDFVDHPKLGGAKMRLLNEPKEEPGANAVSITLNEEVPMWKKKVPKREFVKEEAAPEKPGPSTSGGVRQGQQQQMAKNQQQPAVMARERWWAKAENRVVEKAPNNNEQRLLRERNRDINYRA